jgi:hypothetical protein
MASKEGLGECKIVIYVQIPCFRKGSPKRVCKEALSIKPLHDVAHQGQKCMSEGLPRGSNPSFGAAPGCRFESKMPRFHP